MDALSLLFLEINLTPAEIVLEVGYLPSEESHGEIFWSPISNWLVSDL